MEEQLIQRKDIRLKQYDYSQPGYYFVTICANRRKENVFYSVFSVGAAEGGGPYCP